MAAEMISLPSPALKWQKVPGNEVQYANVSGDLLGQDAYQGFLRVPAGTDFGLHTHSADLSLVVLSGTFYAVIDGKRTEYPAGSFLRVPANLVCESGATKGGDCLVFQHQDKGFDLIPVQG
ncbi:hypothetical protein SAVIM338S_02276 [Streptomyces avidinii]